MVKELYAWKQTFTILAERPKIRWENDMKEFFGVLLTVHLGTILVINQLNAQILLL